MAWTDTCCIQAVATIDQTVKEKGLSVSRAIKEVAKDAEIPAATLKRWYYPGNKVGAKMRQQKKTTAQSKKTSSENGNRPATKETGDKNTCATTSLNQAIETYVQCLGNATLDDYPDKPVTAMSWGLSSLIKQLAKNKTLSIDDLKDSLGMLRSIVEILDRVLSEAGSDNEHSELINCDTNATIPPSPEDAPKIIDHEPSLSRDTIPSPAPYRPLASVRRCIGNYGCNDFCRLCTSEDACMAVSGV